MSLGEKELPDLTQAVGAALGELAVRPGSVGAGCLQAVVE